MERLTKKCDVITQTTASVGETEYVVKENKFGKAINKLGKLEDIMEKYNIEYPNMLDFYLQTINNLNIQNANLRTEIADLQHKLEVAEKALNKMSEYAINDNDLYDLVSDFNVENARYDEDHFSIDTCDVVDYFKEQVEEEIKGESHE